jgi:hypothetical protein
MSSSQPTGGNALNQDDSKVVSEPIVGTRVATDLSVHRSNCYTRRSRSPAPIWIIDGID